MVDVIVGRDDDDLKRYGMQGTILMGKHVVGTGEETHLTTPLYLDVLRPHLIILTGKRGYGKSYSMGVFMEEMTKMPDSVKKNLCSLMIDTQGIFWTMKTPDDKAAAELDEWGLKSAGFGVDVYVPEGQAKLFSEAGVDFDGVFSIQPSQLTADDWLAVFDINQNDVLGILLQRVYKKFRGRDDYAIDDIITAISGQEGFENEKMALQNKFQAAAEWGIFGDEKMPEILQPGRITILDISLTPQNVRTLLVGLLCRNILTSRIKARRKEEQAEMELAAKKRIPMPWIFIDEAHNFLPDKGKTAATDILNTIVKEGRQPGITLVLATQRPNKLNVDVIAQADIIISHMLTARADIEALKALMQTYLLYDIGKYISELPKVKGAAIVLDDNSERIYKVRIRPRQSWHAGASPVAL
jgi:hypothetical protein